ncbi:MAG: efflux RND transporter periplasmic adaptor subunit [Sulfuricaulis sp.]|nr:efflux RND transporter periplasmic adaptor subunit [Sulfuricaulis sp.]
MKNKNLVIVILGAILVLVAAVEGWRLFTAGKKPAESPAGSSTERKVLYWTDPMTPGYRSDKPGKSPFMDMDLVPVYKGETAVSGAQIVTVRAEIVNSLGVRTYQVTRGGLPRELVAQGYLLHDNRGVHVLVDIFERGAGWVRAGLPAVVRIPDAPGRTWDGVVESVNADVDFGARSLKARVLIKNPGAMLKPNLFADVVIKGAALDNQKIMVPREALIRTGRRTAVVLGLGAGRFQPVEVEAGEESGDWIEIRTGVKQGDTVVVSGQFLIDSEASVRASFQRMETKPAEPEPGQEGPKP